MNNGKYCPELVKEICGYIEGGNTAVDSCELCDIGESTYYQWLKEKPEFQESIKKAEKKGKAFHIKNIRGAAKRKQWQASAWWLERRYKDEYAARQEHTGKDGGGIEFKPLLGGNSVVSDNNSHQENTPA